MNDEPDFFATGRLQIQALTEHAELQLTTSRWLALAQEHSYSYHFCWLGRPIIQYPQDIVAMQEIIWTVRPDLIIETGIARGGSLIFSASMLALLDTCFSGECGGSDTARTPRRRVVGIDVDIRAHNRTAIETHPLSSYISLIEGSSISPQVVAEVTAIAKEARTVLICLDSNHTHAHVLAELEAYAPLTTQGSYCVVFDTLIEDLPAHVIGDRPWSTGNSPKTAVYEYLRHHPEFTIDKTISQKLLISVASDGYLRRSS